MKKRNGGKSRSDRPSGRQASDLPEHSGKASPAKESLHQGQGPDSLTQDSRMREQNEGVTEREDAASLETRKPHQQPLKASEDKTDE